MNDIIARIQKLTQTEKKSLVEIALKTAEETGELAQAVLSHNGSSGSKYKNLDETHIQEEAVDVLVCVLSVYFRSGGTLDNLKSMIQTKTDKWESRQD